MTDIILGMGEVGSTIFDLLSEKKISCIGIDIDKSKSRNYNKDSDIENEIILHVCLPGEMSDFENITLDKAKQFKNLKAIIIHSTVKPGTTSKIQDKTSLPVFYSPVRGVHKRFLEDIKRYTKFFATDFEKVEDSINSEIEKRFEKIQWMPNTKTAELAKILVDTTYYGWLINYAQITKMICDKEKIDYDEMWKFADEIHKFLGNRPKMYPGIIGGHCVIPNLNLIDYDELKIVKKINKLFEEFKS